MEDMNNTEYVECEVVNDGSGHSGGSFGGDIYTHSFEEYVGTNIEYYLSKKLDMERKGTNRSWNWAAFFFTGNWLAFRKDLKLGVLFNVITGVCSGLATISRGFGTIGLLLQLAISLYVGFYGNSFYFKSIEERQTEEAGKNFTEAKTEYFHKHSGTSVPYVIIALIASAVVTKLFGLG